MNSDVNKKNPIQELGSCPWPQEGLEAVKECPICGSDSRTRLYEGLTDRVFFCAPGQWTLYQCKGCGSAYLDPRPTPETIHISYEQYFTHNSVADFDSFDTAKKVRRILANGYRNWRYGTKEKPASIFGVIAALFMPAGRAVIDASMRHLPKPKPGQRLLDIGCGNGSFLIRAKSAGWDTAGLDFDRKAVEAARQKGLDVRHGSIETLIESQDRFDAITIAHLIEHVHNPGELLKACYQLLKPGGFIWLETPNLNAQGHQLYGENWRGLETPRHLVLFTHDSIKTALEQSGFTGIEWQPYRPLCKSLFNASVAIENGDDPYNPDKTKHFNSRTIRQYETKAKKEVVAREHITLKAWKGIQRAKRL